MLIKGKAKPEDKLQKENFPRSGLIKRGRIEYHPVPLFVRETALPEGEEGSQNDGALFESEPKVSPEEEIRQMRETVEMEVAGAKSEAERVVADAQTKAKKLIEQAKLYTQTAAANAEREGFEEGKQKAREAAFSELRTTMEKARDTLREIVATHDTLARRMEGGLAKLAIKIAEKVIAREVALDPDVVLAMVRAQLDKMKDRDSVIIHVNPDDYETVKNKKEMFVQFAPHVNSLEIQSDPRVDRGSCMVETNLGTVDASIGTQLEAIELAFSNAHLPDEGDGLAT